MDHKLHLLESFTAQGADGSTYKVCGFERMAKDESLVDGQEHWEPTGMLEYRLAEGDLVNVAPDGSMCVARTGVELRGR